MFRHRWQRVWFFVWLALSSLWATGLVVAVTFGGVRLHDPGDVIVFFLAAGTAPILGAYVAGLLVGSILLVVGRALRRVGRGLLWAPRRLLRMT